MRNLIVVLLILVSGIANAVAYPLKRNEMPDTNQSTLVGPDCLGRYMYITVGETNRRSDGCYVVTIDVPTEGIDFYYNPRGPGMPHYENFLGNTVDLVFNIDLMDDLLGFTDDNPATVDIMVNKWYNNGAYNTSGSGIQCWYYIVVHTSPPYIGR